MEDVKDLALEIDEVLIKINVFHVYIIRDLVNVVKKFVVFEHPICIIFAH